MNLKIVALVRNRTNVASLNLWPGTLLTNRGVAVVVGKLRVHVKRDCDSLKAHRPGRRKQPIAANVRRDQD
jgi:hypothetical protein